ncbi:MAG TPA: TIM barrel protein [Acidobacteriaceae bacterium]|nr:TIM barrel protein [Acidobacteriaceae bacterium]
MPMTRRHFLQQAATAAVALSAVPPLLADPLGLPIGCQTYPVRASINSDFAGTMKSLSAAGFQTIELCSPFGYKDFSSLAQYKPQDLRKMLHDFGLTCISAHFDTDELFHHAEERIAWAKELGLTQMATASLGFGTLPKNAPPTIDDVNRITGLFNTFAAKAHDAGIVAVLHNEGFETTTIDGKRVYDMEIERLDPKTVKLQFQVSTMQKGFDPVDYFTRYPDRYISMHCQDWVMTSDGKAKEVALGKGVVDWKKVFTAAKGAHIRNYFVELEQDPSLMAQSVPYLKSLQV